jgi:hypothetical protein
MATRNAVGLSDLELEVELDMEGDAPDEESWAGETDEEALELEGEAPEEELDEEAYDEEAGGAYGAGDPRDSSLAKRLYELSGQSFESDADFDREIDEVLGEAGRDYFISRAWRRIKKSRALRGLAGKVAGRLPHLKALTQLARRDLRGAIKTGVKAAAASFVPGGPVLLKGLGFEAGGDQRANRAAWQNYAQMTREAYEIMADRLHERVDQPLEASRLAAGAFQHALQRAQVRASELGQAAKGSGMAGTSRKVIWLEPGQTLVIRTRAR